MRFFRWLWERVRNLFRRRPRPIRTKRVAEAPAKLADAVLYLESEGDAAWAAVMICPCGCRELITLNLLPDAAPCWEIKVHPDGTPTIRPSVWRTVGCRSHFFVRQGQIDWCG